MAETKLIQRYKLNGKVFEPLEGLKPLYEHKYMLYTKQYKIRLFEYELLELGATPLTQEAECFCQSYYDDDNELKDRTCGKCDKTTLPVDKPWTPEREKETSQLAKELREMEETPPVGVEKIKLPPSNKIVLDMDGCELPVSNPMWLWMHSVTTQLNANTKAISKREEI